MTQHTNDNLRRKIRGGSWYSVDASWMRSGDERVSYGAPEMRYDIVGFRTALAGRLPR